MELSCHCGAVTLTLPHAPDAITHCNCSWCTKSGFRGIYYADGAVAVSGEVDGYVRGDLDTPCMTNWRCRNCGVATHWTLVENWPFDDFPRPDRMGVNGRLLDPDVAAGLPVRHHDGASA